MAKKCSKRGYPLFGQFFSKIPGSHPTPSPKSEKKWGLSPRWAIRRGENPHFFPEFGGYMVWVPGIFPKSCILEGGL